MILAAMNDVKASCLALIWLKYEMPVAEKHMAAKSQFGAT